MEKYLQSSYVYAFQHIPGNTRVEKLETLGRMCHRIAANLERGSDFARTVAKENLPSTLVPLVKTIVGVKIKSNAIILEALKSADWYLIAEALRAKWFFSASNTSVTNYNYYFRNILPYLSVRTRRQIVKKLAQAFTDKHHLLGQSFFAGFASEYGLKEALLFLPCCGEEFINEAIIRHKINLPNNILKMIFYRHRESAIKYLKYLYPYDSLHNIDEVVVAMCTAIDANQYENFLPLLLKDYPELFIMIQQQYHVKSLLGSRRTKMLLTDSKDLFIKNSREIVHILPVQQIYRYLTLEEFETMFGNSLISRFDLLNVGEKMEILTYYPEEKRANLFIQKVKEVHGQNLLDAVDKLNVDFVKLLPAEQRYKVVRKIIEAESKTNISHHSSEETFWWTYLPVEEAVHSLKIQIEKTMQLKRREKLYKQLIYTCWLNNSDFEMLLEVLRYADEDQPYEKSELLFKLIDGIAETFDLDNFDERHWNHTYRIIKRLKLKKAEGREYWILVKILKRNVRYFINHNLPADDIIELIIELFFKGRVGLSWLLFKDELKFERLYLKKCFKHDYWKHMNDKQNFVEGIYSFNENHKLSVGSPDRLSLTDFPDLLRILIEKLKNNSMSGVSWMDRTKELLKIHEPELWSAYCSTQIMQTVSTSPQTDKCSKDIIMIEEQISPECNNVMRSSEALQLLKDYNKIKKNWRKCYESCCNNIHSTTMGVHIMVKRFLKRVRLYQEVPIKFIELCIEQRNLDILGYILDGKAFSQIALEFLPKKSDEDYHQSYLSASQIARTIRNVAPPISTDIVENYIGAYYMYCFSDYINGGIRLWKCVGHRAAPAQVIAMSKNLAKVRLYAKREAIRMTKQTIARGPLAVFYYDMWNEKICNEWLRVMLAGYIGQLFAERPCEDTWLLVKHCVESIPDGHDNILNELVKYKKIPVEYAAAFTHLVFDKILSFLKRGLTKFEADNLFSRLFDSVSPCSEEWNLPESLSEKILRHFFFNVDSDIQCCHRFIAKVYLCSSNLNVESRVARLSKILVEVSRRWHSLSIEERNKTYNVVEHFLLYLVRTEKCNGDMRVAQGLKNMFATSFQIHQHTNVQITLFLCIEILRVKESFKDFGINLTKNFELLLEIYDSTYCFQIIDLVYDFLMAFRSTEFQITLSRRMAFIEGLLESDEPIGFVIAAKLLKSNVVNEHDCKCHYLYNMLVEKNYPMAMSLL